MQTHRPESRRPNWLFRGLIVLSLGVHAVVFMHVAGIYRSRNLTYIELTLRDMSSPPARSIPRPRPRPREAPRVRDAKEVRVREQAVPDLRPLKAEPLESDLPDGLVERISVPRIPEAAAPGIAAWEPGGTGGAVGETSDSDYGTSGDYLNMVRLRIESKKTYPERARARRIEGRTTVGFVIEPDGRVTGTQTVKPSRSRLLDEAALKAVQAAAPFPPPPARLFKGRLPLEITIVFELT